MGKLLYQDLYQAGHQRFGVWHFEGGKRNREERGQESSAVVHKSVPLFCSRERVC